MHIKKLYRTAAFVATMLILSGCRLLITAEPGGSITSNTGNYDCAANSTCIYTVPEGFYSQTFTATAASGYKFANWTGACSNNNDAVCNFIAPAVFTETDLDYDIIAHFNRPLVGTWLVGDFSDINDFVLLTFYEEGYYVVTEACGEGSRPSGGHEYGTYSWNANTGALTYASIQDSIGGCGLVDTGGVKPFTTLSVSGDTLTITGPLVEADDGPVELQRITNRAGEAIAGTWVEGDISDGSGFAQVTFYNGNYLVTQVCDDGVPPELEFGSYTWNSQSKSLDSTVIRDTLGECGLYDDDRNRKNVHRALDKGGRVILVDFINKEEFELFGLF